MGLDFLLGLQLSSMAVLRGVILHGYDTDDVTSYLLTDEQAIGEIEHVDIIRQRTHSEANTADERSGNRYHAKTELLQQRADYNT